MMVGNGKPCTLRGVGSGCLWACAKCYVDADENSSECNAVKFLNAISTPMRIAVKTYTSGINDAMADTLLLEAFPEKRDILTCSQVLDS